MRAVLSLAFAVLASVLGLALPAHAAGDLPSAACMDLFARSRLQGIVPNAAGGGRDTLMRLVVAELEKRYGFAGSTVANLAGGRGIPALNAVASPRDGLLTLGIFSLQDALLPGVDKADRPTAEDFDLLATVVREPSVWATRSGFDATHAAGQRIVLGNSNFSPSAVFDFLFPAAVLGGKPEIISSYSGSGELVAAVLRGDVDVITTRLSTADSAAKSGGMAIAFVLSEGPAAQAPDLPYFAGVGSVTETLLAAADPGSKAKLEALVAAATVLSPAHLAIITSKTYDADTRGCLAAAVQSVVLGPDFAEQARTLKQFVAPLDQAQTRQDAARMLEVYRRMTAEIEAALSPFVDDR